VLGRWSRTLNSLKRPLTFKYGLTSSSGILLMVLLAQLIFLSISKLHIMPTITMPNSIEGFGISNVEAASFGFPSIVSSIVEERQSQLI
jgi:hypothetical protein